MLYYSFSDSILKKIILGEKSAGFKWVLNAYLKVALLHMIEIQYSVFWMFTAPKPCSGMGFTQQQKLAGLDEGGDKAGDVN